MAEMKIKVFGVPWYRREDYDRLRSVFDDGDKLPGTYDEWLAKAERTCQELGRDGGFVVRPEVDPDDFAAWCASKKLKLDSHARNEFASLMALRAYRAQETPPR